MNIFYLHSDPIIAAQSVVDKHAVKMVLESAQLLCSPFEQGTAPYKRTHFNHPSAKWARKSKQNYKWLIDHGLGLAGEYTFRYGKIHKSQQVIEWCQENMNRLELPDIGFSQPPQAMPVVYHSNDSVNSYRAYYRGDKAYLKSYTKRIEPRWWKE